MTFSEAISDAFSKYAGFSGRSSRAAYWWFYLFFLLALMAAAIIDAAAGTGGVVEGIVGLALFLPELAVSARRLHDAGHSAWWLLISVVPVIGFVVLLVFTLQGSEPPNKWGPGPDARASQASALA